MKLLQKLSLPLFAGAALVFAPFSAEACPPCSQPEKWTATPCSPYNCSPCGYERYCGGPAAAAQPDVTEEDVVSSVDERQQPSCTAEEPKQEPERKESQKQAQL